MGSRELYSQSLARQDIENTRLSERYWNLVAKYGSLKKLVKEAKIPIRKCEHCDLWRKVSPEPCQTCTD